VRTTVEADPGGGSIPPASTGDRNRVSETDTDLSRLKSAAATCRRCKHRIGEYVNDGKGLDLGEVEVWDAVRVFCKKCRCVNKFRPGPNDEHV
jgi:hypothetical protein